MKAPFLKTVLLLSVLSMAAACSPEVGSQEWCDDLKAKEKGEWTLDETTDFAKHCILP